jgi:23S rRNA (cytosine1962-C5)-methyltransferase
MASAFLLPGKEKRVFSGHPWVFRSDIARVAGDFTPGDVVDVRQSTGRFLARALYNPASLIALRILTQREEAVDEAFWRARVERALDHRRVFADMHSCRLIFSEADGLPGFVADAFGEVIVIQSLALGIDRVRGYIVDALWDSLRPKGIYMRNDVPVRSLEGLEQETGVLRGEVPDKVSFQENGLTFLADVQQGQKTGYFLDQKENRAAIAPFTKNARVLDCFSHTGAFALHAAKYGAAEITAVEISDQAAAMIAENAGINGLPVQVETANAFDALRAKLGAGAVYDLVVLDPPAFTKSRAAAASALRGYKEINLRAMRLLREGGILVTCSCSQHVSAQQFRETLGWAARDAHVILRLVEVRGQAKDHPILAAAPESEYLKCVIAQVWKA